MNARREATVMLVVNCISKEGNVLLADAVDNYDFRRNKKGDLVKRKSRCE